MSNNSDPLAATNIWKEEPSSGNAQDSARPDTPTDSAPSAPPIPERLGRYRIEDLLGGGGFGWVYRAFDEQLGRAVAIKIPDERLLQGPLNTNSYRNEARLIAQLDHPHIVPVFDVGSAPGVSCYVVSRLITGRDLAHRLREERFSYLESAEVVAKIAWALHHAHKQGIIHRDIKPGNILLDQQGHPYLADFGLALDESTFGKGPQIAGTPAYMSPEQASGEGHRVDGRADIFSLGVVFYELLTGRRPFLARQKTELLEQIINLDPRPPRQIDDRIPRELERICLKAMAKRIFDRYTTAKDMAEELEAAIAELEDANSLNSTIAISTSASGHATAAGISQQSHPATPVTGSTAAPATPKAIDRTQPYGPKSPVTNVIPRGLRSFDEKDADYFLDLLPGARDREGLPDAVRFWKTRIESRDAEQTFPVGLLYGPSGCGKSSLVKAGLIPRLAEDCTVIYFEATPETTELRLLQALRRGIPSLPEGDLVDSCARARRGEGQSSGQKTIIFIDQFEQWLHAHRSEEDTQLAAALRHCDGVQLQCVLMVRDDFWMSVTRFMRELEVRLVEGWNSAAVDLFGPRHARRVLAAFGRAYGCVPADCDEEGDSSHAQFLRQAVAELTENSTIIPVRLTLLADMMKLREWTPSSLQAIGGASGIGVAFLEETFAAPTAPPEHRYHQQAARNVLKALLYVPGQAATIKGGMRSREDLLRASGYQRRPDEFEHLMQILDNELRLITPTELVPADSIATTPSEAPPEPAGIQYYQLTHDYLVPTLRDWLTRKQRETFRGRAELRLEEHSDLWQVRPVSTHLPAWWEVADILLFTWRQQWTPENRRMMRAALRRQSIYAVVWLALAAMLGYGAFEANGRIRGATLADRVARADTTMVPQILEELAPYRRWALPILKRERVRSQQNSAKWVNTTLALLPHQPGLAVGLSEHAVSAPPSEFAVIREALVPYRTAIVGKLWELLESPNEDAARRVAAALLLARYVPSHEKASSESGQERWAGSASFLVEQLLSKALNDTSHFEGLMQGLTPVGPELVPALRDIYHDRRRDKLQRSLAMNLTESYAGADVVTLADVLLTSNNPERFPKLLPQLQAKREETLEYLRAELAREPEQSLAPKWNDEPLDPAWPPVDASVVHELETAYGMVAERFAFCQTLPLERYSAMEAGLRTSGYRPLHLRPFVAGEALLVACLWTRDHVEWQSALNLTEEQVRQLHSEWQAEGFVAYDLTGYVDGTFRYTLLGARTPGVTGSELHIGLVDEKTAEAWERIRRSGLMFHSLHAAADEKRAARHSWVLQQRTAAAYRFLRHFIIEGRFSNLSRFGGLPAVDMIIQQPLLPDSPEARYRDAIANADQSLRSAPDDMTALRERAYAHFILKNNEEALADFTVLLARAPSDHDLLAYRSAVLSRLNRRDEARQDAEKLRSPRNMAMTDRDYYREAFCAPGLNEYNLLVEATPSLAAESERGHDRARIYNWACMHAVSARELEIHEPEVAKAAAHQAMQLLLRAEAIGELAVESVINDPDLTALHDLPEFREFIQRKAGSWWYVGLWAGLAGYESRALHGLSPSEHLARSKELVAEGFRPVSLSVAAKNSRQILGAASAWHRTTTTAAEFDVFAIRKAIAALTALHLGQPESCWETLRHQPDPSQRSWVIYRCAALNVPPQLLMDRLKQESEPDVRQGILFCLGSYSSEALPSNSRAALISPLIDLYRNDPDPGVHAAAEWLLIHWNHEDDLNAVRDELAKNSPTAEHRWKINSQGQTLVAFPDSKSFSMGSPEYEDHKSFDEVLHLREIPHGFAIASMPVTVEQFERFLQAHPELRRAEHVSSPQQSFPVTMVTWFEALQYCRWLSQVEGIPEDQMCYPPVADIKPGMHPIPEFMKRTGYRLPTEAEWEYACRAGTTTPYNFGYTPSLLDEYAWHSGNSDRQKHPSGRRKPNAWGLFDMHGNVSQWCYDRYANLYIDPSTNQVQNIDDTTPVRDQLRVQRGGNGLDHPFRLRSATRQSLVPLSSHGFVGFRIARTLANDADVVTSE